jgi:predicted amidophosphoribosyltransferase
MLYNLNPDFLSHATQELKEQQHRYSHALKEDQPFFILRAIRDDISLLKEMIHQYKVMYGNKQNN